jgi:K+/H+ antiporter YhaU regulatory subunit KhtT|tara:strand:+ start:190 stop:594 length:405 start_codon:yes stop_codon:yes gene_type:complete
MELDDNQLEKLMQADINMRESIATLESQISEIKTKRTQVQEALNEACRTLNVTSIKTNVGTLTRKLKTRYWTSDWPQMYKFMKENDALELVEKRIQQSNIKQFISDNPELSPPGLQSTSEYTVSILKNRSRKED